MTIKEIIKSLKTENAKWGITREYIPDIGLNHREYTISREEISIYQTISFIVNSASLYVGGKLIRVNKKDEQMLFDTIQEWRKEREERILREAKDELSNYKWIS